MTNKSTDNESSGPIETVPNQEVAIVSDEKTGLHIQLQSCVISSVELLELCVHALSIVRPELQIKPGGYIN